VEKKLSDRHLHGLHDHLLKSNVVNGIVELYKLKNTYDYVYPVEAILREILLPQDCCRCRL